MKEFEKNTQNRMKELAESVPTDPSALQKIFTKAESTTAISPRRNREKTKRIQFAAAAFGACCMIALGGWFFFQGQPANNPVASETPEIEKNTETNPTDPTDPTVTSTSGSTSLSTQTTTSVAETTQTTASEATTQTTTPATEKTQKTTTSSLPKTTFTKDEETIPTHTQSPSTLNGTWYLSGLAGGGISLTFENGKISSSCPDLNGYYNTKDTRLTIRSSEQIALTDPPILHKYEYTLTCPAESRLVTGEWNWERTDTQLLLSSGSKKVMLLKTPGF